MPKSRSHTPRWATWPLESLCRSCSTCATQRPRIPQQNTPGVPGTSVKVGSLFLVSPTLNPALSLHLSSEVLPLMKHLAAHAWISVVGPARSVAWDVLEKTGRTVLWEWGDGDWAWLMASLLIILFSLQPGQRSVVIRQRRQPGTMCTEQQIASYGWHWMAASACVFIPRATVNRKVRQPLFLCYNIGKRPTHRMRVRPGFYTCWPALCY